MKPVLLEVKRIRRLTWARCPVTFVLQRCKWIARTFYPDQLTGVLIFNSQLTLQDVIQEGVDGQQDIPTDLPAGLVLD